MNGEIYSAPSGKFPLVVRVLGWLVLLGGCFTALMAMRIALIAHSPVWFGDEWQVAIDYQGIGNDYPLEKLWAQHNEHRIPIIKSLQLFDLLHLQSNHTFLLILNWLIQVAEALLAFFFLWKFADFNADEMRTVAGLIVFCVLNPNQLQNFDWAFQATFFFMFFFALFALGSLVMSDWTSRASPSRNSSSLWLFLSVIGAFLAECSLASGVLVWVVLLLLCVALPSTGMRSLAILGVSGGLAIWVYMAGYHSPPNATSPMQALGHPFEVFKFLITYFGESWRFILPSFGPFFAACAILGVIGITLFRVYKRESVQSSGEAFALASALLMVLTGLVTALGRQGQTFEQARESRYQTPAMLFWFACFLFAFLQLKRLGPFRKHGLAALQILLCCCVLAEAAHIPKIEQNYRNEAYIRNTAGAALESGVDARDRLRMIYPFPDNLLGTYTYLVESRLMAPPLGLQNNIGMSLTSRFRVVPSANCPGSADSVRLIGVRNSQKQIFAAGWAYQAVLRQPLPRLIAVTEDGIIRGIGVSGAERADVEKVVPRVHSLYTGWNLYALVPDTAKNVTIYGILPDSNLVCAVDVPKPVPQ